MKDMLLGLLIGGIIGLWFGVNLGKGQALISNPFTDDNNMAEISKKVEQLQLDVRKRSKELYDDTKKVVDDAFQQ